ncbi:hypothetical protein [Tsuneonella sp. HG222]
MNGIATIEGGVPVRVAPFGGFVPVPQVEKTGLQYLRASGLAQARLQLAVLSGNRRRALREIDRLVEIDRQLESLAVNGQADATLVSNEDIDAHLASQKTAIAGEKLALTAAISLPTIPPPGGALEGEPVDLGNFEVIEDTTLGAGLARVGLLILGLMLVVGALAIAVPLLAAG